MQIQAYQQALIADGWEPSAIYADQYDPEKTARFKRAGFTITFYRRADSLSESVAAWGPDGLAVDLPPEYDWAQLQANCKICSNCGRRGDTVRLGFANRVCPTCRATIGDQVEYPGWND